MRKTVLVHGLLGGALIVALRLIEYRYLALEHALEIYGGLVALLFSGLGIWVGLRLTRPAAVVVREVEVRVPVEVPVPVEVRVPVPAEPMPFTVDVARRERLGITPREHEILQLVAAGLSTREIAGRLFVSENTVKTHTSRLLTKLDARRRTQAIQRAREAGLIP